MNLQVITKIASIEPYLKPGYTWDDFLADVGHPSDTGLGGNMKWNDILTNKLSIELHGERRDRLDN